MGRIIVSLRTSIWKSWKGTGINEKSVSPLGETLKRE